MKKSERQDVYTHITAQIIASLEQGVRPWMKPWSGEDTVTKISRPLRHNGVLYRGSNVLVLYNRGFIRAEVPENLRSIT